MEKAGCPAEIFLAKILWLNTSLLSQLELRPLDSVLSVSSPVLYRKKKSRNQRNLHLFHPYVGALESLGNYSDFGDQPLMSCLLKIALTVLGEVGFRHCHGMIRASLVSS